jgi:tetratricopeptide (TPR) repeat protein
MIGRRGWKLRAMGSALVLLLLSFIVTLTAAAQEENAIGSLRLGTHAEYSRLVLEMIREPGFAVLQDGERTLLLQLDGVKWVGRRKLADIRDHRVKELSMIEMDGLVQGIKITLNRPVREARPQWWEDERKLALDIYVADSQTKEPPRDQITGEIKAVRLGTHPAFSRLVVEVTRRSAYRLEQTAPNQLILTLPAAGLAPGVTLPTAGDPRIGKIALAKESKEGVSFIIDLTDQNGKVVDFWWGSAHRLVVDVYPGSAPSPPLAANTPEPGPSAASPPKSSAPPEINVAGQGTRETVPPAVPGASHAPETEPRSASGDTPESIIEGVLPTLPQKTADSLRETISAGRAKRARAALETLDRLSKQTEGPVAEALQFLRADLLFELGRQGASEGLAKAAQGYRDAMKKSPDSSLQPWALLQMARLHLHLKRYVEALGYVDLLLTKYPETPHRAAALLCRGRVYLQKDRADLALDDFQEVLTGHPQGSFGEDALVGLAICFSLRGENQRADELFANLEKEAPKSHLRHPEILYYWGRNDIALLRFEQGREKLFRALNVGEQPEDRSLILAHIAESYRLQGKTEPGNTFYHLTVKLFPGSEGALVSQVRLAEEGRNMELLEQVVTQSPKSDMAGVAVIKMAAFACENGNYEQAVTLLRERLESSPNSKLRDEEVRLLGSSTSKLVEQLREKNDSWAILTVLKNVKAFLPKNLQAKAGLWEGAAYSRLGLWEDAARALQTTSLDDLEPTDQAHWVLTFAGVHEARGENALAESLIQRTLRTGSPGSSVAILKLRLGELKGKDGRHQEAVDLYRDLLQKGLSGPERLRALLAMAESLRLLGQSDVARVTYLQVLSAPATGKAEEESWRSSAQEGLGEIAYGGGDFQGAAQNYLKCLEYGGLSQAARLRLTYRLADCYDKMGARAEADRVYETLAKEGGDLWQQAGAMRKRVHELQGTIKQRSPS